MPSLRAKRSNPVGQGKSWIASSQELLAMTLRVFRHPLRVIASACEAIQSHTGSLDCFVGAPGKAGMVLPVRDRSG
jgi:hypothetical protein